VVWTDPKILTMPEQDRNQAVAAIARWFGELLNDDDFRAKVETMLAKTKAVTVRKVRTLTRPLLLRNRTFPQARVDVDHKVCPRQDSNLRPRD
jgi:hypothetical protein